MKEQNEFTMLRPRRLHDLVRDHKAAQVLYQILGGKETHIVIATRWTSRWLAYKGEAYELFSSEILVKDEWNRLHMMILRVIDDLEILDMISEDPLGDIWDFPYQGKACFGSASSTVVVYLTSAKLPDGKAVCRFGFPLIPDDIMRKSDYPTQIISAAAEDGSNMCALARYLENPTPDHGQFGRLSDRVEQIRKTCGLAVLK